MSVHDGHRQRLKTRFLKEDLGGFTDIQALELLLFYCIPQGDTNELAHRLLERFKSFSGVMDARIEDLKSVKGVGDHAATFLKLIPAMARYYCADVEKYKGEPLTNVDAYGDYLKPHFLGQPNEMVYLLCMDAKCKVLECFKVGEGSVNSASVPVRRVVELALSANATTVVLAHNHPSGIALPSNEDIVTTQRVAVALDAVEITLADHLVFADGDYTSMVQSGYYRPGAFVI